MTENTSTSGFEVITGGKVNIGELVSIRLRFLDLVHAQVTRITPRGFGCRIVGTAMATDEFLGELLELVQAHAGITAGPGPTPSAARGVTARRHERHVPQDTSTTIQFQGREPVAAQLIDVSQSGAAIRSMLPVRLGQRVLLGFRPSKVVRVFDDGFAVVFDEPLAARSRAPVPAAGRDPGGYAAAAR